jgi:hypothetical protein
MLPSGRETTRASHHSIRTPSAGPSPPAPRHAGAGGCRLDDKIIAGGTANPLLLRLMFRMQATTSTRKSKIEATLLPLRTIRHMPKYPLFRAAVQLEI